MTVPHLTILTCARSDARFPDFTKVECSVMVTGMFAVSPARGRASRSYEAQRERRLADAESYAHVRHPKSLQAAQQAPVVGASLHTQSGCTTL